MSFVGIGETWGVSLCGGGVGAAIGVGVGTGAGTGVGGGAGKTPTHLFFSLSHVHLPSWYGA